MIKLDKINRDETLRYLGGSKTPPDDEMKGLLDECEKTLLSVVTPKILYRTIPLTDSSVIEGNDIKEHLKDCHRAVIMCVTLGANTDKIIRAAQITDMAQAVVLDAMASAAAEQLCEKAEKIIAAENPDSHLTWRFSPGYGDYPIETQSEILRLLDAPRKIGLCTNESFLLTPTKSVTAIIGLSEKPVENRRKSCSLCNLNKTCKFRKAGTRCEI